MLLSEQIRVLTSEANTINYYSSGETLDYTWQTLENYGTITVGTFTAIAFKCRLQSSGYHLRLKMGSWYVWGTYDIAQVGTISGLAYLPNGTHAVIMEGRRASSTAGTIIGFQAGPFKLKDENQYGTATTFLIGDAVSGVRGGTFTVNIPVRRSPIGTIANTAVYVGCFGTRTWAGTVAETQFANSGDTLAGSVVLKINGNQVNWTYRSQDALGTGTAFGWYVGTHELGTAGSISFYKGTETFLHMNVYASPWLLPGTEFNHQPAILDFPPGSTFYSMLEPLAITEGSGTVRSQLGKKRCITYGTSTDYYNTLGTTSGVVATHNYTFEMIEPDKIQWLVGSGPGSAGMFSCISHVGVDIR